MHLEITQAQLSDLADIKRFQILLAQETEDFALDPQVVEVGVSKVLTSQVPGQYYVARTETGKNVGCLMIQPEWSDWRDGYVWWIHSVYVAEAYRELKVFSKLYQHVKQVVMSDPGLKGLRLFVEKKNIRAQKVYHALGMNGEHYHTFEWMKPTPSTVGII